MEKTVKGATKIKLAAPKSKYVEVILQATNGGDQGVADVFRILQLRLRDSTWTIVFKSLIIVHLMIREGAPDVTLRFIAESPKRLAISPFTEVQTQGSNIRRYAEYLLERVRGYRDTKQDFVRSGAGHLKRLSVDKGLLRENEAVQSQIRALLKCDMISNAEPDNEISFTAFRLLILDLLELFKVMNEGTINVLEHYFEMSRPDAERALGIYKTFAHQTEQVVQYLALARQYENSTRLEVPRLKHAPTTLTSSLEEYLNDPDFEINRRQYLAQQQAKKSGKPLPNPQPQSTRTSDFPSTRSFDFPSSSTAVSSAPAPKAPAQQARGPAPDLIDFFASIEDNQQSMAQAPPANPASNPYGQPQAYQQNSFAPQQNGYNPFLQTQDTNVQQQYQQQQQQQPPPQQQQYQQQQQQYQQQQQQYQQQPQQQQQQPPQSDFSGAAFGGFAPQAPQNQAYSFPSQLSSILQNDPAAFQPQQSFTSQAQSPPPLQSQQTSTNPFRQSMMQALPTNTTTPPITAVRRQSTNPFAKSISPPQIPQSTQSPTQMNGSSFPQTFAPSQNQFTNPPFSASSTSPPPSQTPMFNQPQRTGTNPFARTTQQVSSPGPQQPMVASPTGSTNPFRQAAFVNQQTGLGWQHSDQGTFSGFDVNSVNTVPVFPRPGQS